MVLDLRLAWRPRPNLKLAVVWQHVLDNQHAEFVPTIVQTAPTEVEHSVYGK